MDTNHFSDSKFPAKRIKKYLNQMDRFFAVSEQIKTEYTDIIPAFIKEYMFALQYN